MKIYVAGNVGIISRERAFKKLIKRRLLSFHEVHNKLFAADQSFNLIKEGNEIISSRKHPR